MSVKRRALAILLGLLVETGCPRRFDPRAEEIHSPSAEAEGAYRGARQQLKEGDARGAEQSLQEFAARYPKDPLQVQATLLRARAALGLGEPQRARELLAPLAAEPAPGVGERARFLLGLAQYRLQDFAAARALLRPFGEQIVDSEEGTELHAVLADLARREGQVKEALQEYERYYKGAGVRPPEQAYVREQVRRLAVGLSPEEQQALRQRFELEPAPAPSSAPGGVLIGMVLPLSGKDRPLGERVLRGALWGADLLQAGAPAPVELVVRDSGSSPEQAAAAVAELAREGVVAVVGSPGRGGEAARVAEAAERAGLPVIDLSPQGGAASDAAGRPGFGLLRSNAARARALVRHLLQRGARTVAVVTPQTAYGKAMAKIVAEELAGKPARLLGQLSFPDGATTFTQVAKELGGLRPEALVLPMSAAQLELIAAQLAASDVISTQNVPGRPGAGAPATLVLTTADGLGERLLRNAGRYLQGAVLAPISLGGIPSDDQQMNEAAQRYQQRFGEEPGALDALGHDAVRLLSAACEPGQKGAARSCSPQQVARALPGLRVEGVTGPLSFEAGGQRGGPPLLVRIEGAGLRVVR